MNFRKNVELGRTISSGIHSSIHVVILVDSFLILYRIIINLALYLLVRYAGNGLYVGSSSRFMALSM